MVFSYTREGVGTKFLTTTDLESLKDSLNKDHSGALSQYFATIKKDCRRGKKKNTEFVFQDTDLEKDRMFWRLIDQKSDKIIEDLLKKERNELSLQLIKTKALRENQPSFFGPKETARA